MADPKLEIEQRLDRIEEAILTIAGWSEQTPKASGALRDHEIIEKILRGETGKEPEANN